MKWPLSKLYKDNAAAAATPHPLHCVQHLLLKEKASVDRKKSSSISALIAKHTTIKAFSQTGQGRIIIVKATLLRSRC